MINYRILAVICFINAFLFTGIVGKLNASEVEDQVIQFCAEYTIPQPARVLERKISENEDGWYIWKRDEWKKEDSWEVRLGPNSLYSSLSVRYCFDNHWNNSNIQDGDIVWLWGSDSDLVVRLLELLPELNFAQNKLVKAGVELYWPKNGNPELLVVVCLKEEVFYPGWYEDEGFEVPAFWGWTNLQPLEFYYPLHEIMPLLK